MGTHRAPHRKTRKPFLWITAITGVVMLAATATFATGLAEPLLEKVLDPEPIKVVSVTWVTGPELGPVGYAIPATAIAGLSENEVKFFLERPADGFAKWLADHGAVSVGSVVWQIVLEGGLSSELIVVGLRPVLDGSCAPPQPGGAFVETVSEGPVGQSVYDTDIDAHEPVFVIVDVDAQRKPAFTDIVLRLAKGERNSLLFRANSRGPHCRFRIELTYLAGGRNRGMTLTAPGGRAFEVTGYASAYQWVYRPPVVCGKVSRVPGQGWDPKSTKCS